MLKGRYTLFSCDANLSPECQKEQATTTHHLPSGFKWRHVRGKEIQHACKPCLDMMSAEERGEYQASGKRSSRS